MTDAMEGVVAAITAASGHDKVAFAAWDRIVKDNFGGDDVAFTVAAELVPMETYTFLYCICMRPRFFLACVLPLAANFAIRKHSQNQDLFSWTYVFSNSSSDFDKYMMPSMMLIMLRTKLGTHISTPPTIYTTSLIIAEFEFPR